MTYLNSAIYWIKVIGWHFFAGISFIIIILALAYISFLNSSEHKHLNKYAYAYVITSFILTLGIIIVTSIYFAKVNRDVRENVGLLI